MEGIIALLGIFGMPVLIVGISKYYKYRTARLDLEKQQALSSPGDLKRIETLEQDRKQLRQRVENLETIVTSVDLELNARLSRLAAHQSAVLALPPATPKSAAAATPGSPTDPAARADTLPSGRSIQALSPGSLIADRYLLDRPLGQGGMGQVYLAHDQKIGEDVALKVITANLAEDPSALERFRREVASARKITHPSVIRIHDLGEDAGLLFLSMEYFAGLDLGQVLSRRGALPLDEGLGLLGKICDALSAAHTVGVVHRDLKPPNILVNERGDVRVIDFGLAKASYMRSMTATGLIMGTPEYMAPEQVRGRSTDHRTDLYALGALAYHVLTGQPPFTADSPIAVGFMHCSEAPAPPRQLNEAIPEHIEAAILRCLEKDPAQRPDSAVEVKAALLN